MGTIKEIIGNSEKIMKHVVCVVDLTWKEMLPVVKVGEEHDPAEEEGEEHEEAVDHIQQAVLQSKLGY